MGFLHTSLALFLCVHICMGCHTRSSKHIEQVVWADDGSGHAYVVMTSKWQQQSNKNPTTRYKHQLFIQNREGLERRALTSVREHQVGALLYYMKKAGYVLLEVVESDTLYRYEHISLDGRIRVLDTWDLSKQPCLNMLFIPSPNGEHIAHITRISKQTHTCEQSQAQVRLLHAHTLQAIKTYTWPVEDTLDATWTLQNTLVVQSASEGAWEMNLTSPPHPVASPACMFPKTTSSMVSQEGVMITQGYPEGAPVETVPEQDPDVPVFGCNRVSPKPL